MPHIALPEGLPGITSAFAFRPETAAPMRALAEVLLGGPSSLTSGEREMIATVVLSRNDCCFCQTSHRAAAAHHLDGDYGLVDARPLRKTVVTVDKPYALEDERYPNMRRPIPCFCVDGRDGAVLRGALPCDYRGGLLTDQLDAT